MIHQRTRTAACLLAIAVALAGAFAWHLTRLRNDEANYHKLLREFEWTLKLMFAESSSQRPFRLTP